MVVQAEIIENIIISSNDLNYCILRNYEEIPDTIRHDVDILLDKQDYCKFVLRIKKICLRYGLKMKKVWDRDSFSTYVLYDITDHMHLLKLDIWTDLCWRGISWIDTKYILHTRKKFHNFYKPSIGCEAAVSMMKELFGGGDVPQKYYNQIQRGVKEDRDHFLTALKPVWKRYADFFADNIMCDDWNTINKFKSGYRKELLKASIRKRQFWKHISQVMVVAWTAIVQYLKMEGMLIVFAGPDGSGKTTVIDGLKQELKLLYPKIQVFHTRLEIFPELHTGLSLSNYKKRKKTGDCKSLKVNKEKTRKSEQSIISRLASDIVFVYYTLEFIIGRPYLRSRRMGNSLVIFDRYYYDFFVQLNTRNLIWNKREFLCRLIPQPDFIFHLYADGKTVYERKGELNVKEIDIQNKLFEKLLKNKPEYYKVNTEIYDQNECITWITQKILEGKD